MLFKVFCILTIVTLVVAGGDWHPKTKPTTTEPEHTTPIWITETIPPTRHPTCPPVTQPLQPTIYSLCCGQNEVYLPRRIAPNCDVYCSDIGKKCHGNYDFLEHEAHGCYCLPGHCRTKYGKCIRICEIF